MNVQHIIYDSLIQYDSVQFVTKYLTKNAYIVGNKTTSDFERSTFTFYEKTTDRLILKTEVETLAVFYDKFNIWSWAWSQTGLSNAENSLCKKMLERALNYGSDLSYIKGILTTSRGVIKNLTQIDINLALATSIIKQPYVYKYVYKFNSSTLIYYFMLLNQPALEKLGQQIRSGKFDEDEMEISVSGETSEGTMDSEESIDSTTADETDFVNATREMDSEES